MRQPPTGKGRAWVVLSHPTQYLTACCCQLDLFPLADLTQRLRNPVWPPRVESVQPTLLVWDSADITESRRAYQEATGLPRAQQGWGLTGCPPQSLRCHSELSFPPGIVPSKTSLQIPTLRLLGAGSQPGFLSTQSSGSETSFSGAIWELQGVPPPHSCSLLRLAESPLNLQAKQLQLAFK